MGSINKIVVCGLGAIGSNVLTRLAIAYPHLRFVGLDFDRIEDRNIATQTYLKQMVGTSKAQAMAAVLNTKVSNLKYTPVHKEAKTPEDISVLAENKLDETLFIDAFDNANARKLFESFPDSVNVCHIGFNPNFFAEIIWHADYGEVPEDLSKEDGDICTQINAGPWIGMVTSIAAMVVIDFIENGKTENKIINWTNIKSI